VPYVRTVKTASGPTAVQIVYSSRRGSRDIEHIGSAHDDGELELLTAAARQRLAPGQGELDLGLDAGAAGGPLPVASSRMGCLLDVSPTQLNGQLRSCDWPFLMSVQPLSTATRLAVQPKFVLSGADLLYWRRKQEQWRSLAERAPTDEVADFLHKAFEPTARAIKGLEKALAGLGLLDQALALDLRRPQDYFQRIWAVNFRASDLTGLTDPEERAR